MDGVKISELPVAETLGANDIIVITQPDDTKQTTLGKILEKAAPENPLPASKGGTGRKFLSGTLPSLMSDLFSGFTSSPTHILGCDVNNDELHTGKVTPLADLKAALDNLSGGGASGWEDLEFYPNNNIGSGGEATLGNLHVRINRSLRLMEFEFVNFSVKMYELDLRYPDCYIGYLPQLNGQGISIEGAPVISSAIDINYHYADDIGFQKQFWLRFINDELYLRVSDMNGIQTNSSGNFYPVFYNKKTTVPYSEA